ncbi:hypothetical protein B0H17DRAFT_1084658 [Mycena rosella]|uniref:Uncharacterized protein n=1 Tax=Mycena rosella TaxID=1033263 RepID=A0AAD7G950_MYCRO|nr:hypothetical protein B0H17DRAFT_1084658 [Mycena rosella]
MFKQIYSTAILAIAILTLGASAAPQTPPPGIGDICTSTSRVLVPVLKPSCRWHISRSRRTCMFELTRLRSHFCILQHPACTFKEDSLPVYSKLTFLFR